MTDLYTPCTFTVGELSKCQKAFNELEIKYNYLLEFTKRMSDNGDICCQKCIESMAEEALRNVGES